MTALRILNLIAWVVVLAYMAPSVWRLIAGRGCPNDPVRLTYLMTALTIIGFNARRLLMPDNLEAGVALYVLSAALGVYILVVARAYGRGA